MFVKPVRGAPAGCVPSGSNSARGSWHRAVELGPLPPRGSPSMCARTRRSKSPETAPGGA